MGHIAIRADRRLGGLCLGGVAHLTVFGKEGDVMKNEILLWKTLDTILKILENRDSESQKSVPLIRAQIREHLVIIECKHKNWRVFDSDSVGSGTCLDCGGKIGLAALINGLRGGMAK